MSKAVRRGRANLPGNFAVIITTVSLFAGGVMGTMTVEITQMRRTVSLGSARRVNFDVLITAAFPLDGSVTITTTVATTRMSRTVR